MEEILSEVMEFFSMYDISISSINLRMTPAGQVSSCMGKIESSCVEFSRDGIVTRYNIFARLHGRFANTKLDITNDNQFIIYELN